GAAGARAGRGRRAGRPGPPQATPPVPLLEPRDGPPTLVTSVPGLDRTVAALAAGKGPVAVDAERASGFRYGHRAFLVQLRRGGAGTVLIDPMACPNLTGLGRLACGSKPGSWVIVTTWAADGTPSEAGRGGCQLTWASTRIAVCPLPASVTSTTMSRAFSTPGTGDSENVRSQDGGPKSASPGVNRRGRCACSPATTPRGRPGARPKGPVCTR